MKTLRKAKEITSMSLNQIKACTNIESNNKELFLKAISEILGKDIFSSCTIKAIFYNHAVKVKIKNTISYITLSKEKLPGRTLKKKKDPTELGYLSYNYLKQSAKKEYKEILYSGILYGTVKTHTCDLKVDCPECGGSGICSHCHGEKQIVCPVCRGSLECVSCEGSGYYICQNCNGEGTCPECNDGWVKCDECHGTGKYKTTCKKCDGSGWYDAWEGEECYACDGSGKFVAKCNRCNGKGKKLCKDCHGTSKCSHCHGNGEFRCKACHGSGTCGKCQGYGLIKCPNCHGKGKCIECEGYKFITCPRCQGTGYFQTFTKYTLSEYKKTKEMCTLPIEEIDIATIDGDMCYNDVIYDFFAQRANVFDYDSALKSLDGTETQTVKEWLSFENNSPFKNKEISNDYFNSHIELFKIPVIKLILACNSKEYTIWIVGHNKMVYYDELPSGVERLWSKVRKIF